MRLQYLYSAANGPGDKKTQGLNKGAAKMRPDRQAATLIFPQSDSLKLSDSQIDAHVWISTSFHGRVSAGNLSLETE